MSKDSTQKETSGNNVKGTVIPANVALLNALANAMKRDFNIHDAMSSNIGQIKEDVGSLIKAEIDEMERQVNTPTKGKQKGKDSALSNPVTSTGAFDKIKSYNTYGFNPNVYNYPLWMALYLNSWVFRRAVDKPCKDVMKLPIIIRSDIDENVKNTVLAKVKKMSTDLTKLFRWGTLFGGAVAVVLFDTFNDADYMQPISNNLTKIRDAKSIRLYVTDRWYGVRPSSENVNNLASIDYGKPKEYTITFPNGTEKTFHHEYVLRYEHRDAPQLIKQGYLQGWGLPEGIHIFDELCRDEQLKTDITSLVNKSLIEVIKMEGMRGIFMGTDPESEAQVNKRLEMVNWARSFNSLTLLDSNDDYIQHSFGGLGGLSDLLEKNMWLVSAACEMQGVMFGDLKQGFSNDVDALARYDDVIQTRANDLCRPCIEKLLILLFANLNIESQVDFDFGSLLTEQETDKKQKKVDSYVSTLSKLLQDGVIDVRQYLESLDNFIKKDVISIKIDDESIKNAEERVKAETELPIMDE